MRRLHVYMVAAVILCLGSGAAFGFTFSVDQPPSGSGINDGQLVTYSVALGGAPSGGSAVLVGTPVDALHIGSPVKNLVAGQDFDGEWTNLAVVGTLLYSLDHGDPFPIGILPDSSDEVYTAWQTAPNVWNTKIAQGSEMGLAGDVLQATEPNLNMGPNAAFDDDVDALDSKLNPNFQVDTVYFSIDDRISLVPNLPADMQTLDVYARFANGGIAKVIDGVLDLGLVHQGDGVGPKINDDIDAMILVELDDNPENNLIREILYEDPSGAPQVALVDLGDAILFSLDPDGDLPYEQGGTVVQHFTSSLDTRFIYISTYNGTSTPLVSHADLGLITSGDFDDIDALAAGEPVPEPGTIFLIGTGALAGLALIRRRRMK